MTLQFFVIDVYPPKAFEDYNADSESVEEATGNEGASMELRYHRAVVVLWPKDRWIDIICEGSTSDAVKHMQGLLSKCSMKGPKNTPVWENVKKMAKILAGKVSLDAEFLEALLKIDDIELLQDYLHTASLRNRYSEGKEMEAFCLVLDKCLEKYGWKTLADALVQFANGKNPICQSTNSNFYLFLGLKTDGTLSFLLHFCSFKIEDKKANDALLSITRNVIKVKYPEESKYSNVMDRVCNMAKVASVMDPALLAEVCIIYNQHLPKIVHFT